MTDWADAWGRVTFGVCLTALIALFAGEPDIADAIIKKLMECGR
jgi:hypothetical protein